MQAVSKVVERVLAWMLIGLLGFSILNVLWQVFTRFVLNNPSSYTEELARYLLIWVGLLAAAYGVGTRSHLAIDLLPLRLQGEKRRWLEVFIQACLIAFSIFVMIIGGIRLVSMTLILDQTSAAMGIKLGYVYLVLPLGGIVVLFFSTIHLIEALRGEVGGGTTAEESTRLPID